METGVKTGTKAMTATTGKKVNPSAHYVGMSFSGTNPMKLNYRQGKQFTIEDVSSIEVVAFNISGRRLTVNFKDASGKVLMTRRVYKEWVARMVDKLTDKEVDFLNLK